MNFVENTWDYTRKDLFISHKRECIRFYEGDMTKARQSTKTIRPFPAHFADAFKAWFVLTNQRSSQAHLALQSARHLYHVLQQQGKAGIRCWSDLNNRDLRNAALLIDQRLGKSSRQTMQRRLGAFITWAVENELVRERVTWTPSASPAETDESSETVAQARLDRLPHRRLLEALGEIYQKYAVEPRDRLIICALGIMLVAGFRISELLSLPVNCLGYETDRHGRKRWYLRYWRKKGRGGGAPQEALRYLSPLGAELAQKCVAEIVTLTESARKQSKIVEQDDGRIRIPWGEDRDLLSADETSRAFSIMRSGLASMISAGIIQLTGVQIPGSRIQYRRPDVERALAKRSHGRFAVIASEARRQLISETLLIEFELNGNGSATSELLVGQLRGYSLLAFIGGATHRTPSAFMRFGYTEDGHIAADGIKYRMRSHMFRHWLNTIANKAGMTAFQITLWMQRSSVQETMKYLHSVSEIAELTRDLIPENGLQGRAVELFRSLPPEKKPEFLNTIQEAHQTDTAICGKALLQIGCEISKQCESDCLYYLWSNDVTADAFNALGRRRDSVASAIEKLHSATAGRVHPRQLDLLNTQLKHLNKRLESAVIIDRDADAEV